MGHRPSDAQMLRLPTPALAPLIDRLVGYHHRDLTPGSHLGLPSASLTLVISLAEPTHVSVMPDPCRPAGRFRALIGGLHTSPAVISYERSLHGIQLDLTPRGVRALLGVSAGELRGEVLELEDLLGRRVPLLLEQLCEIEDWSERFALLLGSLACNDVDLDRRPTVLEHAWQMIIDSGGRVPISRVAATVGFSTRQLSTRFAREYGLRPKQLSRVLRFQRSHRLLQSNPEIGLARASAECGYYDQSHMIRDWSQFARCPPSSWLRDEELPFLQDSVPRP